MRENNTAMQRNMEGETYGPVEYRGQRFGKFSDACTSKDRWDEVLHVLAFLRTPNRDINNPLVLAESKEIEEQFRCEREKESSSYRELFGKPMRKRLFLAMAVQGWAQLSGVNMFLHFIVYCLDAVGVSNTLLYSSIQYILFIATTVPTILWTDRCGRRSSLLIGALSISFWMYLIGGIFATFGQLNPVPNQPFTWVIINQPAASRCVQASLYLASTSFAMSWAIEWMYPVESIPLRIRAKAVSFSTAANWIVNLTYSLAVPPLFCKIH
ncbi:hypothetical protein V1517DRAFT_310210 [Lipomyces orientalis]|uniref:Uncharacterized protein n=1 Tax=Lipomyces orientalis TaxID=1233043 RepID=A0ACC3TFV6_9ASCO